MHSSEAASRCDAETREVRLRSVETVLDDWFHLRRFHLESCCAGGHTHPFTRLSMARGDRVGVLLHCRTTGTVVLTSQFRVPTFLHGPPGNALLEVPGGLLDDEDAPTAIRREIEEETGFRVTGLREAFVTYLAPQLSSERTHLFLGEYDPRLRAGPGGGVPEEGEDIRVWELPLDQAVAEVLSRPVADAKTLLLLLHAQTLRTQNPTSHANADGTDGADDRGGATDARSAGEAPPAPPERRNRGRGLGPCR